MKTRTYSFGYWLRRRRKALDLTQRALALAVSCSEDAIRKIEADERRPSRRLAERIADRLAIAAEERAAFLDAARAVHSSGALAVDDDLPDERAVSSSESAPARNVDQHATRTAPPDRPANGAFVGRSKELEELRQLFDEARAGQGRIAMLTGQPGIGKTRTSQELAKYASGKQAVVLWGRCYEGEGAPSYWPWVQALRAYVRGRSVEQLHTETGNGASSIAEIVEEIRDRMPEIKPIARLEPEAARFRLFDAIATLLQNLGRRSVLLLIMDDLHWADAASLRLLEYVAAEVTDVPVFVLGTYRDTEITRKHPLSRTLAEITRHAAVHRTTLRGLNHEDVGRFIAATWPESALPAELVAVVHRQTEGNPLFVAEVMRLLVQEGRQGGHSASAALNLTLRIPASVRDVIGRRLDGLSERCNQVLAVAAVIGRQFTLSHLGALLENVSEEVLVDLLDEAIAAHVIEEVPHAVDRFQFTHALIGETLAAELSSMRRLRLHAQIGGALESLYGADVAEHAAELAHHFAQAAIVSGSGKLIRYSILAGERALSMHANEEALAHFERALAAKELEQTDAETAAIFFGLGRAQLATLERHRYQVAVATLHRAFEAYLNAGDMRGAVEVADYSLPDFPGFDVAMAPVIQRAIEFVPADSNEAGRLQSRRGRVLGMQFDDYAGAASAFAAAIAIARKSLDVALEMRALVSAAYVDFFHRRYAESIRKGSDALAMAVAAGDLHAQVTARYWTACARRDTGDLAGMQSDADAIAREAERLSHRFWLAGSYWLNENYLRLKGEWSLARQSSERGLSISPRDFRLLATRALLDCEAGDCDGGLERLKQLLQVMRLTPPSAAPEYSFVAYTIPIAAGISGDRQLLDEATECAKLVLATPGATPIAKLLSQTGLALTAAICANASAARRIYESLGPPKEVMPPPAGISFERVLGRLAFTYGDYPAASVHFGLAMEQCTRNGYRAEQAWVAYDQARCLAAHDLLVNRMRIRSLQDECHRIATELGMRPLRERIESLGK